MREQAPHAPGRLHTLPIQIRPIAGEGPKSFIERLAAANHLKPRHLRTYLCEPPLHRGRPTWERLAAASGREPANLREILDAAQCPECGRPLPATRAGQRRRWCSSACRENSQHRWNYQEDRVALCETCGKKMTIAARGPTPMWCSPTCCQAARRTRRQSETELAQKSACAACGTLFTKAQQRNPTRRWCSRSCRNWAYTQRKRPEGSPPSTPPPKLKQPTNCTIYSTPPSTRGADLDAGRVPRPAARRHSACTNRLRSTSRTDRRSSLTRFTVREAAPLPANL